MSTRHAVLTGNPEWYTPRPYLDAAVAVMGAIDLDPASSDLAQRNVQAAHYFTAEDDGLRQDWSGRVWLNPPYAQPLIEQFVTKLACSYVLEEITAAILLTNNSSETLWWQMAARVSSAICFPRRRIRHLEPRPTRRTDLAHAGPQLFLLRRGRRA